MAGDVISVVGAHHGNRMGLCHNTLHLFAMTAFESTNVRRRWIEADGQVPWSGPEAQAFSDQCAQDRWCVGLHGKDEVRSSILRQGSHTIGR